MLSWTAYCVVIAGLSSASSSELNSTEKSDVRDEEIGNRFLVWQEVPAQYVRSRCFTKGRSGVCVPLGQCPILEQQVRNLLPALLVDFLAVFTDACGIEGGYCCPDIAQPPMVMEMTTERPWAWVDGKKKLIDGRSTTVDPQNIRATTKSWYQKTTLKTTQSWHNRKTTKKPARPKPPAEMKFMHENRKLLPEKICGMDLTSKIIGGDEAALGEYPWLALLRLRLRGGNTAFICGGSLISSRYVVSAAHCFVNNDLPKNSVVDIVRLGEHDTQKARDCTGNGECSPPVQDIPIENFKVHDQYNPSAPGSYNDISLVRLARPAEINQYVAPICLPMDRYMSYNYAGEEFDTAGWGKTSNGRLGKASSVKLKVNVPYVTHDICAPQYIVREVQLRDTQLCAGGEAGKDSCQGDSGGPLMYSHLIGSQFRYVLAGVVSTGPKECGQAGSAAIYTRVGKYIGWILDNMRE